MFNHPTPYRVIRITSDGFTHLEHLSTLLHAYRVCLPQNQTHWHIRMFPSVAAEFLPDLRDEHFVQVSYNDEVDHQGVYTVYYIQATPRGPNTPIPSITNLPFQLSQQD